MSNRTYICLDCRTAKRAEAAYGLNTDYRCSQCRGRLHELPWRWRIPKKSNNSEWKKLREMVLEIESDWIPRRAGMGQKKLEKIDSQIEAVSRQRESESKEKKIKYLRWKRRDIEKRYTEQ